MKKKKHNRMSSSEKKNSLNTKPRYYDIATIFVTCFGNVRRQSYNQIRRMICKLVNLSKPNLRHDPSERAELMKIRPLKDRIKSWTANEWKSLGFFTFSIGWSKLIFHHCTSRKLSICTTVHTYVRISLGERKERNWNSCLNSVTTNELFLLLLL